MAEVSQSAAPVGPEAQYQRFLQEGRFMLQRSVSTGRYVFYPRVAIPGTGETDLEWVEAAGTGRIYAITVNRSRNASHNVALIDLDEGVRMMSRVADRETAAIGSRVRARVLEEDGQALVVFDVIDEVQA
ncbi:OB-fold domain-containing protein [Pseudomonas sp. ZM23]|uniref:OB-fold domain-containing protein n=1 Tax=Pseudomonas triclosanedens TaxID=2961893 RepID=A0ABY6ZQJ8_9PSED|nr:OB-fold domain-containing protein [Pseudomonas triclosanedens]MCP8467593.1 OB-fold domain-containing protein [Pseudomonas triclosanedens]MCP8473339.1 OB-fold domain-containing protein [Pseudomonas triclosanedens]MCP8479368.1 OB-fold domain-containing protein [Pseudomonas triclosanedens]WAI47061.1 OB-fold domain-containing protein [Pseudomonas triclosanedens]